MEDKDVLQKDRSATPLLALISGTQALSHLHLVSNSYLPRYALNPVQQPPSVPQNAAVFSEQNIILKSIKDPSPSSKEDLNPTSWTSS